MLTPLPPARWNPETAAHLALRAGFGQTPDESKKWSQQGLEVTLNHLLQIPPDNLAPPPWAYPTRDEDLLQRLRDPAMIAWLDLGASQKEHPNENFARELMELFTLGEGHYTEDDVKTAARAFTGYRVAGPDDQSRFVANQFDPSEKTFLGKTGPWRGDQVIDIILAQPQCAKSIATKIWRFFAYDDPSPELVDALSGELRRCGYELKPFMKVVLSSQEFFSSQARNAVIKSPVQFLVHAQKTLVLPLPSVEPLFVLYLQLSQTPFYPPNVKGWDGGTSWINTATLTYRYELPRELVYWILPEQVGLPKGPSPTPTPSPTPPLDKALP